MPFIGHKTYSVSIILNETALPRLEAELLIAFLLKKNREYILTHRDTPIPSRLYKKFKDLEAKRLKYWPIAYLVGEKEFYGLNFKVSPAVLTPRPESEMIIDQVINQIEQAKATKKPLIIDLGTGSGAIIITIAHELRKIFPPIFKKSLLQAVDISASALKIAKTNAKSQELDKFISFQYGNLLSPLKLKAKYLRDKELIITANLPYLTPEQIKNSPTISREPVLALDGGPDGLKYYTELWQQIRALGLDTLTATIFCEIDPSQAKSFKKMTSKYFPQAKIEIITDLAGRNRLAKVSL